MKTKIVALLFLTSIFFAACSKKDAVSATNNQSANQLAVGASANDFLSAAKFQSINLEILYMPGYAPDPTALNNLIAFLNTLINKPNGINITQRAINASGKTVLTIAEIRAIEKYNRTIYNTSNALGVCLIFVDATYSEPNVLGVAYNNTSMVVLGKKVMDNSGGINQPSRTKLETTVEEHEFGHLLGLVNTGSAMQVNHEDAAHAKHCINNACLMYFQTQANMMGGILMNSPVPGLDDNCRNDLRANGGR